MNEFKQSSDTDQANAIDSFSRRGFLKSAAAFGLAFSGLQVAASRKAEAAVGFGSLVADPLGVLNLPAGFTYKVIMATGDVMSDGFISPARPDGMATFPGPGGKTIIMRNHELNFFQFPGPFGAGNTLLGNINPALIYDIRDGSNPSLGAVTTLLYDTNTQTLDSSWLSLAGTERNCAGGATPWGTWITCEETSQKIGSGFLKNHGYAFEVNVTSTPSITSPVPLLAMGRFNHEAIAVDPGTGFVYQTEDDFGENALFYRYMPNTAGDLAGGGTLQALGIQGQPSFSTLNRSVTPDIAVGQSLPVSWINLTDIDSPLNDLRFRGFAAGAARFARCEGIWHDGTSFYFAATSGGRTLSCQIFKYTPSPVEGTAGEVANPGTLELFIEPNNSTILNRADNLTVSPWGDLIVCEDGFGVTTSGQIYEFARNALGDGSEFAGSVFSPDGTTLFVNMQDSQRTVAITGPFPGLTGVKDWQQYQ